MNPMREMVAVGVICISLLTVEVPLLAHHSFAAEYDGSKLVTLRGRVTRIEFINPHSWIHMDVKGPNGKVINWAVEAGSPNALIRLGWTKDSLPIGTEIVVQSFLHKIKPATANGRDLAFPDGRKLFLGSSATGTGAKAKKPEKAH